MLSTERVVRAEWPAPVARAAWVEWPARRPAASSAAPVPNPYPPRSGRWPPSRSAAAPPRSGTGSPTETAAAGLRPPAARDAYEVGLPNQGVQILYEVLNELPDTLAERTYA
ncbi:hypothetical protein AB0J68_31165, partial [Micromonospora sp. NPDC049580]|uniref:hypothetical protein n=1 Tax=Micromonospora sp. NPDC049580 TaxID=3154832 RepID=UPI0034222CCF